MSPRLRSNFAECSNSEQVSANRTDNLLDVICPSDRPLISLVELDVTENFFGYFEKYQQYRKEKTL